MSHRVIGTCSFCKGAVAIPLTFMGICPPIPKCLNCGRKAKNGYGPVIDMENDEDYYKNLKENRISIKDRLNLYDSYLVGNMEYEEYLEKSKSGISKK